MLARTRTAGTVAGQAWQWDVHPRTVVGRHRARPWRYLRVRPRPGPVGPGSTHDPETWPTSQPRLRPRRREAPDLTGATPRRAPRSSLPLVDFVAYAEDCMLSGPHTARRSDRLTDMLNDHEELQLVDVLVRVAGGPRARRGRRGGRPPRRAAARPRHRTARRTRRAGRGRTRPRRDHRPRPTDPRLSSHRSVPRSPDGIHRRRPMVPLTDAVDRVRARRRVATIAGRHADRQPRSRSTTSIETPEHEITVIDPLPTRLERGRPAAQQRAFPAGSSIPRSAPRAGARGATIARHARRRHPDPRPAGRASASSTARPSSPGRTRRWSSADLGADVVKVEPPEGDATRGWGPPWVGDEDRDADGRLLPGGQPQQALASGSTSGAPTGADGPAPAARRRRRPRREPPAAASSGSGSTTRRCAALNPRLDPPRDQRLRHRPARRPTGPATTS